MVLGFMVLFFEYFLVIPIDWCFRDLYSMCIIHNMNMYCDLLNDDDMI